MLERRFLSHNIELGQRGRKRMPFSEVCMHMRIAGKYMDFELLNKEYPGVQLYEDGRPFSGSITTGEAGIFHDSERGYYYYPHEYNAENMDDAADNPPS